MLVAYTYRSGQPIGLSAGWCHDLSLRELSGTPPAAGSRCARTPDNINRKQWRVAIASSRWPPALVDKVLVVPSGLNPSQEGDRDE